MNFIYSLFKAMRGTSEISAFNKNGFKYFSYSRTGFWFSFIPLAVTIAIDWYLLSKSSPTQLTQTMPTIALSSLMLLVKTFLTALFLFYYFQSQKLHCFYNYFIPLQWIRLSQLFLALLLVTLKPVISSQILELLTLALLVYTLAVRWFIASQNAHLSGSKVFSVIMIEWGVNIIFALLIVSRLGSVTANNLLE